MLERVEMGWSGEGMGGYVQIFKMVRRSSIACIVDVESCKCLVEDCMLLMHELFFESIVTQMMRLKRPLNQLLESLWAQPNHVGQCKRRVPPIN